MHPLAYPCANVPEVPEGHYGRLCHGRWQSFDDALLHDLAYNVMKDSKLKRLARAKDPLPTQPMPSGYVYFGQFVDHDITRDGRTLDQAGPDVEQTLNYRTPRLDLDLLYGKDPLTVPCIYEEDRERLKLGRTERVTSKNGRKVRSTPDDDLPRLDGTAVVVDARSDENLVIAQMHVLFAKFHNGVLKLLRTKPELSLGPKGRSLFEQARRFVTWHYQWIVVNDFLPLIVRGSVLSDVKKQHFRLFPRVYTPADCPMALPVEFTMAAYRFGHSMVREQYFLNRDVNTQLSLELIHMTKRGGGIAKQLPATYVIDWDHFFFKSPVNIGQTIDTFITEMMYDLPEQAVKAFHFQPTFAAVSPTRDAAGMSPPLPELTLKRGSKARLPSGQEFARAFGYELIDAAQIPALPEDKDFFEQSGLNMRTPLWYYLLREADLEARSDPGEPTGPKAPIQKLGSIGSRIVAEVFYQLLNADCDSIAHAGKKHKPPEFVYGRSKKPRPILSLPDLIEFVQSP